MEESIVYTIQSEFTEIKETVVHIEVMLVSFSWCFRRLKRAMAVSKASINYIAKFLMITPSHLYGTMTFYNRLTLSP